MRKAFTLIEVNLAIMIMAGGILSVLGLYSLGYRESRQSREDVAAAAYADSVVGSLINALSDTNVTWKAFNGIKNNPEKGWAEYLNQNTGLVSGDPDGKGQGVYDAVLRQVNSGVKSTWGEKPDTALRAGLVIRHETDSPIVMIAFRATRHASDLLSMPLFYTEVRFQGKIDEIK